MSSEPSLHLGEGADEADWRALVEQGLKGAQWARLVGKTADGIDIAPLYREPDIHTATDISGMPGAAPFIRGARQGWLIRQAFAHPDPQQTNREILADLEGGVGAIELVVDPSDVDGVAVRDEADLGRALAGVILEAAPVSLDAGPHGLRAAEMLRDKLKGVAAPGTAFNLDPIGASLGADADADTTAAFAFTAAVRSELPNARFLRADARFAHEAGGSDAHEIAAALHSGIAYLRGLDAEGLSIEHAAKAIGFAIAVGPDVLIEAAKLRALRLCWARVLEASGAPPEARAAHIHAFSSRRMMTRYDAWTNILRVATASFAAAIGGADDITTYPLTDALGLPTPFARRVARNTQHVLLEECRLGHVADPAGGAWFVEKLTRELAERGWALMQEMQAAPAPLDLLAARVAAARETRQRAIATRRETITGVTDFPLLDAQPPEFETQTDRRLPAGLVGCRLEAGGPSAHVLHPIRWAEPFETLRDRAEPNMDRRRPRRQNGSDQATPSADRAAQAGEGAGGPYSRPSVFFATLGALAAFGSRAQFARNLFAAAGVGALGEEEEYADRDAMIDAFGATHAHVAVIVGDDGAHKDEAENAAQRLKAAGAHWVLLAGKPGDSEAALRAAGVDQFVFAGQDALKELETLHAALGIVS